MDARNPTQPVLPNAKHVILTTAATVPPFLKEVTAAKPTSPIVPPNAKPPIPITVTSVRQYQHPMAVKSISATVLPNVRRLMPTTAGTTVLSLRLRLVPTAVPRARLILTANPNVPSAARPNATPDII